MPPSLPDDGPHGRDGSRRVVEETLDLVADRALESRKRRRGCAHFAENVKKHGNPVRLRPRMALVDRQNEHETPLS